MVSQSTTGTVIIARRTARQLGPPVGHAWPRAVLGGLIAATGAFLGVSWQQLTSDP